jgi:C4-dicarboxylate-specific signal transduction histidine kinase
MSEKKKIIIVEDESLIAHALKISLQRSDYEVLRTIRNGEQVLPALEELSPDLVLMDISLSGSLSGVEVAKMIKDQFDIPVVFLTSYADPATIQRAKIAGPYGYLVKPYDDRELNATLEISLFKYKTDKELDKYRLHLEELVEERTRELALINDNLELKIDSEIKKRNLWQQAVIQKSKLASLGELSAGLAHEINQPLNIISITLDNILKHLNKSEIDKEYLKKKTSKIFTNIDRINSLIKHIQIFSREQQAVFNVTFDLNKSVSEALRMISAQYKKSAINLRLELSKDYLPVYGNPYRTEQVILNLVNNARAAVMIPGGSICLSTSSHKEIAELRVKDNGHGIPEDIIDRVMQPFFTTRQPGEGTGLGLSISYGIVRDMKGNIEIQSTAGLGTQIIVTFPLSKKEDR